MKVLIATIALNLGEKESLKDRTNIEHVDKNVKTLVMQNILAFFRFDYSQLSHGTKFIFTDIFKHFKICRLRQTINKNQSQNGV